MKKLLVLGMVSALSLIACSQKEKPQSTAPADYAETHRELIQNPEKDSAASDSIVESTYQPEKIDSTRRK